MKTSEYLSQANIDAEKLAELLGHKTTATIYKKMEEEMPERWVRKLDELSDLGIASETADQEATEKDSEREPNITDEDINSWISSDGRESDKNPNLNQLDVGNAVIGPQQIKLSTLKGYIEMVYGGAETLCKARGDEIAAETIHAYTPQYVEAWIDYIKTDERILKYLEQLNIGTPLGNLIGVHAISIGAYVLARVTAKEIAANAAANGHIEQEI